MRTGSRFALVMVCLGSLAAFGTAAAAQQNDVRPYRDGQVPMLLAPPLPPATQLEAFHAPLGAVVTVGYERLGEVKGIVIEVRELRESSGGRVRGVAVYVPRDGGASEFSYVDIDELPVLLRGIDQLLTATTNPTQFRNFEMYYATKGELEFSASSSRVRGVEFSVEAGRLSKARRDGLTAGELHEVRTLIEAASQKLATMPMDK